MLYDTMSDPPPPGSPLESVLIMVWHMRRDAEFFGQRLLAQAMLETDGDENTNKALKDYAKKFYPYLEHQQKRSDEYGLNLLKREIARGPLAVIPLESVGKTAKRVKKVQRHTHAERTMSSLRFRKTEKPG